MPRRAKKPSTAGGGRQTCIPKSSPKQQQKLNKTQLMSLSSTNQKGRRRRSTTKTTAFLSFESYAQKGIFVLYMSLWVMFGLLNQSLKSTGLRFNTSSAVLLQSLLKIGISFSLFVKQGGSVHELLKLAIKHRDVFLLYMIPAFFYTVYDILAYVNLQQLDPTTYFLLLNLRLVLTGLVHQIIFQRQLNRNQWIALIITTLGCAIKTLGDHRTTTTVTDGDLEQKENSALLLVYGSVFIQIISSTIAGVYIEFLLKKQTTIPLHLQNLFMYVNSVLALLFVLSTSLTEQHTLRQALSWEAIHNILFQPQILSMVIIMSFVGLVTSVFLKYLDSVRKAIASALELVVLPLLTAFLFPKIPITRHLVLAVACVSYGVYLYSVPVVKMAKQTKNEEELELVEGGCSNNDATKKKLTTAATAANMLGIYKSLTSQQFHSREQKRNANTITA
mmetsp:Transcript_8569/g.9509  ORF Transcript_8569/g.9509 Transcript_8569/m.9509 type:complete len:447 (-) Transcript_8569:51-1391(-)